MKRRDEEMWQQRDRQMMENVATGPAARDWLADVQAAEKEMTRQYLAIRRGGKTDAEAIAMIRQQAGRPKMTLPVYEADQGDLADLELMFG